MARLGVVLSLKMLVLVIFCACISWPAMAVHLSALPKSLVVTASRRQDQVLHAGEDTITVTWSLNATVQAGSDASYKSIKLYLCYAPASQKDRGWRKANDDLGKDKACQFKIAQQPYTGTGSGGTLEHRIARDIPSASYYVRAYALDESGAQVAYGQSASACFAVVGLTGIHSSIEVAAGVFSAFSIVALAYFFVVENRRKN